MSPWIYSLILFELAIISFIDIKTKKISNLWSFAQVAAAILFYFSMDSYQWSWTVLIYPIIWFVVGFGLFLLGIMGAGDSKLITSLYLLIPLSLHHVMLEKIVISTIVIGFMNFCLKITKDFKSIKAYALSAYWQGLWKKMKSSFSFAPVIMMAWILLGVQLWF
jgi:Flp pilus assembly protein protease CpaA